MASKLRTFMVMAVALFGLTAFNNSQFIIHYTPPPSGGSCTGAVVGDLTPGALILTSTLQSISVTAPYIDAHEDGTAAITFQKHTGDTPHNAYTPYIDRRTSLGGVGNPFVDQARGAVVGLTENTSYDVTVTWNEGGGTPSCVNATISTLSSTPPTGSGSTRTITDNTTQAASLAAANPGDTLSWTAGSYTNFTLSRSGNAGAWITLDGGGVATINGSGTNQNILLNANFVILKNFILSASDFHGIALSTTRNHIIIQGNVVQGFSTLCAAGPSTTHAEDMGIYLSSGGNTIMVLDNSVTGSINIGNSCLQASNFDGPGIGIGFNTTGTCNTCIIRGNTVVGNGTRDAISLDNSNGCLTNNDWYNNTIGSYVDDGIEPKGCNLNVRMWGNIITEDGYAGNINQGGDTCWSNETTTGQNGYGPSYFFRNQCRVTNTEGSHYKGPAGPTYIFHNSMWTAAGFNSNPNWGINSGGGTGFTPGTLSWGPYIVLNNAALVGEMSEQGGQATTAATLYDYNCGIMTGGGAYAWHFRDNSEILTFAQMRAIGQDLHSVQANPQYISTTDLHLQAAVSPCINLGIVLNNFNTADSAWPSLGSAPDAGAYEKQ
jgi:hypothetical protein